MSKDEDTNIEIDFAKSILEHNQSLINFVDTKAGIILAADGAILALLAGSSVAIVTSVEHVAFGVAVILLAASALFGFLTIKPRVIRNTPPTRIFFGSILKKTREDYRNSFSLPAVEVLGDYANNIYTLSLIQKKKFAYLNSSLYCLVFGLIPIVVIIISQHV